MSSRIPRPLICVVLVLFVVVLAPGAAEAQATSTVTVVHGLRGLVADVYLDGKIAIAAFQPERVSDPMTVPAGKHRVEIRTAGASATSPPALAATVDLVPGTRYSAVAHLDPQGRPALSAFTDDYPPLPMGKARAVIRHVAAAGPVDVHLGSRVVAAGLVNGKESDAVVPAATYTLAAMPAGQPQHLLPVESVPFREGQATVMYLIGSMKDGTLTWLAQQVKGLQTVPGGIRAGDGPLPQRRPTGTVAALAVAVVGGLALVARGALAHGARR
jgi:hypothetical protein